MGFGDFGDNAGGDGGFGDVGDNAGGDGGFGDSGSGEVTQSVQQSTDGSDSAFVELLMGRPSVASLSTAAKPTLAQVFGSTDGASDQVLCDLKQVSEHTSE